MKIGEKVMNIEEKPKIVENQFGLPKMQQELYLLTKGNKTYKEITYGSY